MIRTARIQGVMRDVEASAGSRQQAAIANCRNHWTLVIVPKISPLVGTASIDNATIQAGICPRRRRQV
ncbi:hypothetical protein D3C71_2103570 [compost metagenome]